MNTESVTDIIERIRTKVEAKKPVTEAQITEYENFLKDNTSIKVIRDLKKQFDEIAKRPEQLSLGLLPTRITRVSFCRPIKITRWIKTPNNKRKENIQVKKEEFITSWGRMNFYGPDCGALEEDVLLVILKKWVENGHRGFALNSSEILDILKYKRQKNGKHRTSSYNILDDCLSRLALCNFWLEFITKGKRIKKHIQKILEYENDAITGETRLVIGEWFAATIGEGLITGIDLEQRQQLKGAVAKFMHRFLSSHSTLEGSIPIQKLADVIGFKKDDPKKEITRAIKKAVSELKRIGFLEKQTRLENDVFRWVKSNKVLSGPKLINEINNSK